METLTLTVKNETIRLSGKLSVVEQEAEILNKLNLTGIETNDRLLIQECIDKNKLKSNILYSGNSVYSFNRIVKDYRQLQKSGNLLNMTNLLYDFFMCACGDIAHYDMMGYICYYDNDIRRLEQEFLKHCSCATRFSDVDKIFKELKIGKYFKERDSINLNLLSLNKLKSIIKDCGWNVNVQSKDRWQLQTDLDEINKFYFDVEISEDVQTIIYSLIRYSINYDPDSNIEKYIELRDKEDNTPIRFIVNTVDTIKRKLMTLASDMLYKSKYEVEIMKDKDVTNNYEFEMER